MGMTRITVELPKALIERAQAVDIGLDELTADVISVLEKHVEKQEALQYLMGTVDALSNLPDEEKPTDEEIIEEIRQVRRETAKSDENEKK